MNGRRFRVLLLSEDSAATRPSSEGFKAIQELTKKLLQCVFSGCQTQLIDFFPLEKPDLRKIINGNKWKSTKAKDRRAKIDLFQYIATNLLQENSFVFFHIDGDRRFADAKNSENSKKFDSEVVLKVLALIKSNCPNADSETIIQRLRKLVPFYSIEAWTFQNTEVAIRILNEKHNGKDVKLFENWRNAPEDLDEVLKIKDKVALSSNANYELASNAYPTERVLDVKKSFKATVDHLNECDELKQALKATNPWL